jgi:hypothetical protein
MKTYYETQFSTIVNEGQHIPKDPANRYYAQFLQELERGEAELVPYTPPTPTWDGIRAQRDALLAVCDWTQLPDVNLSNKQEWTTYRENLRNIPQNFSNPIDVVFPEIPN